MRRIRVYGICMCNVAVIEEGNWISLVDDVKRFNGGTKFDAVLCLGNSFAHLPDFEGDLLSHRQALRNFKALLKPGGILVIDHRNYDEILASGQIPSKNIYYNVSINFNVVTRTNLLQPLERSIRTSADADKPAFLRREIYNRVSRVALHLLQCN